MYLYDTIYVSNRLSYPRDLSRDKNTTYYIFDHIATLTVCVCVVVQCDRTVQIIVYDVMAEAAFNWAILIHNKLLDYIVRRTQMYSTKATTATHWITNIIVAWRWRIHHPQSSSITHTHTESNKIVKMLKCKDILLGFVGWSVRARVRVSFSCFYRSFRFSCLFIVVVYMIDFEICTILFV